MTDLRVHVQRPGGILIGRGHKTPAALGSAAAVEASAACSDSAEAVLRWAQRSAASCAASLGLAFSRGYAGSSQSDCPAAAGVGRRDGALEAHRLLRALRAPWRSGPLQQAARVKGSHGGLPSLNKNDAKREICL
jgi:hypothetical protein